MKIKILHNTIILFVFFILQGCNFNNQPIKQLELKNDSIFLWLESSKNTSYSLTKRKLFLKKAYDTLKSSKTDTSITKILSKVAYQYLKLKDTVNFKKINEETHQLALKLKDTFTLADSHWSNANYYKKKEVYDSAYYHYQKAYNYFETLDNQYYAAKMLYGMAFIKGRYRDYSGSEILIIKAISKYKILKKNKSLYASYNHLALLQSDIKEYDKALFYHNKAIEYLSKIKNNESLFETSLNNIGNVYLNKGDYSEALNYYNKILENDSLKVKDLTHYARVIDNKAYCKLLKGDTINVKKGLFKSLKIRDSINSKGGIVISKIHLSKYYSFSLDTVTAIKYAKEAKILAKEIKNSRDYLISLKILSNLDKKKSKNYLEEYIKFSDSLQNIDRKIQNKFTRIAYETDEYIEETKRLSQQKIQLLLISLTILLIISLVYYIKIQKSKSEKLLLETEQQKANEQVYILTLRQQTKLEEEKTKERIRISEELHDGILGKLFGVRVDMGFLEIKGNDDTLKKHKLFLEELQTIEKEIREVSHKLNTNINSSNINFNTILNQLIKNKSKIGNFAYVIYINETVLWENINEVIKVNIYRIIQEALQNIIKYAKAKNVNLSFLIKQNHLVITIKDDGIGFKVKKIKKGIGIKNMKSRIKKLKGDFKINSEIKKGTTIHLKIPIQ